MNSRAHVRIGRFVLPGEEMSNVEARDLANRVADGLSRDWREGVPSVSRATLRLDVPAESQIAVRRLAEQIVDELRRKLL